MAQRGLPRDWKRCLLAILVEPNVERILIFGSRARERRKPQRSGPVIVRHTGQRFLERIGAVYERLANADLRLGVDVDVLVYTPGAEGLSLCSGRAVRPGALGLSPGARVPEVLKLVAEVLGLSFTVST